MSDNDNDKRVSVTLEVDNPYGSSHHEFLVILLLTIVGAVLHGLLGADPTFFMGWCSAFLFRAATGSGFAALHDARARADANTRDILEMIKKRVCDDLDRHHNEVEP